MSTPSIIIIEDDLWLAETLSRHLVKNDIEVIIAKDAPTAIDMIDERPPQLIVLDMLLKTTTGMALLYELRSHRDLEAIPVILMSSIADRIPKKDLHLYNIVAVFDKATMTPSELEEAIRKYSL